MITPAEIKQKAGRRYQHFLRSILKGTSMFPMEISFSKAVATEYHTMRAESQTLEASSKACVGYGYTVERESRNMRKFGKQALPSRIFIDTETDYLKLIGKEEEAACFKASVTRIRATLPQLEGWLLKHPGNVSRYADSWEGLLRVCEYFLANPRPQLYIRELPIQVHTKFIEEHRDILRKLLDYLLPEDAVQRTETEFEKRFGLRYAEPLIRFRLLDTELQRQYGFPVSDLSTPVSQFARLKLHARCCIITENKMNFLTLPAIPNCFAIFIGGDGIALLKGIDWLRQCPIVYWGDLDAKGFAILSNLRSSFPQTISAMMDRATLDAFEQFQVTGTPYTALAPKNLTLEEQALYTYLARHTIRLEQERIAYTYAVEQLQTLVCYL